MLSDQDKTNIQWLIDNAPSEKSSPEQIYKYWLKIRPIKRSLRRLKNSPSISPLFADEETKDAKEGTFFEMELELFAYLGPKTEAQKQEVLKVAKRLVVNLKKALE